MDREVIRPGVELSVSVHAGDLPFLDETYRHVTRQLTFPFERRRIVVDRTTAEGRFAGSHGSQDELNAVLAALRRDGLVDSIDDVDWSPEARERVAMKWFGRSDGPSRHVSGSPVHQYLWALDTARSPYVLHLDSDMMFHVEDACAWISEGLAVIRENPQVAAITPEGGPPRAEGWRGFVGGRRAVERRPGAWHRSDDMSTRIFLVDRQRIDVHLPLQPRDSSRSLEESLTDTFAATGLERWSRNDDRTYAIHPRRHNENHVRYLSELIGIVEDGDAPLRRTGHRWDIRTEGRHFLPWWLRIQKRKIMTRRQRSSA